MKKKTANRLEHFETKLLSFDLKYGHYFDNQNVYVMILSPKIILLDENNTFSE